MIVASDFVFIHQPKTGGSFVRDALREINQRESKRLSGLSGGVLRRLGLRRSPHQFLKIDNFHGTCHEIPPPHRAKQTLSIVRNPLDYYVSFYHFGWWASHPEDSYRDFAEVKRAFPRFPELSFDEFLLLANRYFNEFEMIGSTPEEAENRPGYYTTQFILYFFKDPPTVYKQIDDAYINDRRWTRDMFDVHFMRTHNLNEDLYQYLAGHGYRREFLEFLKAKKPVRPQGGRGDRPSRDCHTYYSDAARALVLKKEKLLFAMFPDLLSEAQPEGQH